MDSSSRKVVAFIAIFTLVVLAVMASTSYMDSGKSETTAATESPTPLSDSDEAAISAGTEPSGDSAFSTDVPTAEDIPAINGEPSMVLDGTDNKDSNPVAPESPKAPEGAVVLVE